MTKNTDFLFTNAIVLTMDDDYTIYEPGAVAVHGDSIVAVGDNKAVTSKYTANQTLDCDGKVLMPGLVNAHTHAAMTLLRGLADDLRLDVWLLGYIMPVEREFVSPDFVSLGTKLACAELIRSGVTCFADMYYYEEKVAEAAAEAGLRAICGQTVLKFPSPDARSYEDSLASAQDFIQNWKDHPLIIPSIAPHSPYTCTEEILREAVLLSSKYDIPLQTHLAETSDEVEKFRDEFGMPVIPYVKKLNLLDTKTIAAHCVHVDDGEIQTLLHHNVGVAHNPSSNLKLSSGFAPISEMIEAKLNVGIGTDGPASNNDLDMFEEMRLASLLAKGSSGDPTSVPARTTVAMGTSLGAQAVHFGNITGSLESGKRADMIVVDLSPSHNAPRFRRDPDHIYTQLIYAAKSSDVTDVLVNGKLLMRDGRLTTIDEEQLIRLAEEYAKRIDIFLIKREKSVLSKLVAIGRATQEESFEVQTKVRIKDPNPVIETLEKPEIEVLYHRHYYEYDTYMLFKDPDRGSVRYREDEYIDADGNTSKIRYRLTLIGPTREDQFPSDVMLSRSRYLAPAIHSLRFYREYFKPTREILIEKDRLRWRILFHGTEFYINIDRVDRPDLGYFLEIKSRTWSRVDAEHKARVATDLIRFLGTSPDEIETNDYLELIANLNDK